MFQKVKRTFTFQKKKVEIPVKFLNATKRSSIAEHFLNNSTCANSYNLNRFKLLKFVVMCSI